MKRLCTLRHPLTVAAACLALVACGGGGSDAPDAATPATTATSASFSPTTAKASNGQNVPLRWTYAVNDGQPIKASLLDVSIGVSVGSLSVQLDPGNLQRQVSMQGTVTADAFGTPYTGTYNAAITEALQLTTGRTTIASQTLQANLTLSGGGDSASAGLTANSRDFAPAYDWFPDREDLDKLPIGYVQTVSSNGKTDINITVTDETPIVKSNLPTAISERWTVLERLPTMVVRGRTYANVVRLSRQTRVPDFSGNLTSVTMTYWVAKGVGMIKGVGIYRVLNVDNAVYELVDTNLSPA